MFHEICIYEAKLEKQEEIEQLMKEVKAFYKRQKGINEVYYSFNFIFSYNSACFFPRMCH